MKILIFTEGTAIMHASAMGVSREERVAQSASNMPGLDDFRSYVPNGDVVAKLQKWKSQGAEIHYLTSRKIPSEIADIQSVLQRNDFPDAANVHFRAADETYSQVAEEILPDLLIEDDCESIGGEAEMTYPHLSDSAKKHIRSIVIKEFAGIDDLSDDLGVLKSAEGSFNSIEKEPHQ